MNRQQKASPWVIRHAGLIPQGGTVLDLACGSGRHTRLMLELGHRVTAVDRDLGGIDDLCNRADVDARQLDLEGPEWPLADERFNGIIVTNYLYRPHLPKLVANLCPDGVLIYATFAAGNEKFGRPRNPDFLLQPDELQQVFCGALHLVDFEEATNAQAPAAIRQRICAVAAAHPAATV